MVISIGVHNHAPHLKPGAGIMIASRIQDSPARCHHSGVYPPNASTFTISK